MDKLEIITCSLPRDLPVARLALDGVKKHFNAGKISVVTPLSAFAECRQVLGSEVELLDERDLSEGMSLSDLEKKEGIEGFPKRAGWYLQQIAKLGYALRGDPNGYYLIWDCDTVPLRPLNFFTSDDRPFYTLADEENLPYFQTYERLFGYRPNYIGSFISQHGMVEKKVAREMLAEISARHPTEENWCWAIIANLAPVSSLSLFSEYETYGNYVNTRYPETIAFRRLPWLREGAAYTQTTRPTQHLLDELAQQYYFASFETWQLANTRSVRSSLRSLASRLFR